MGLKTYIKIGPLAHGKKNLPRRLIVKDTKNLTEETKMKKIMSAVLIAVGALLIAYSNSFAIDDANLKEFNKVTQAQLDYIKAHPAKGNANDVSAPAVSSSDTRTLGANYCLGTTGVNLGMMNCRMSGTYIGLSDRGEISRVSIEGKSDSSYEINVAVLDDNAWEQVSSGQSETLSDGRFVSGDGQEINMIWDEKTRKYVLNSEDISGNFLPVSEIDRKAETVFSGETKWNFIDFLNDATFAAPDYDPNRNELAETGQMIGDFVGNLIAPASIDGETKRGPSSPEIPTDGASKTGEPECSGHFLRVCGAY
jgi:archaellum component FlaF (FlaF/FlaG flagellin family)